MTRKRMINLAISSFFYLASSLWSFILRLLGVPPRVPSTIIYYHVVLNEYRERFASQMDALLRHAKVVRADVRSPLESTVRHVAVTFDDGSKTVLENAFPELAKRDIPFTVFIITGMLGRQVSWEKAPERLTSSSELRTLCKNDLVTIGSHTVSHPFLPGMAENAARVELHDSKIQLEALLQREVTLFSFPYGGFTDELVEWCREAGYQRVFTTLPQRAFETGSEFACGRVRVDPTDWPLEFRLKVAGAYRWLPMAIAIKKRLKFTINPNHPEFGTIEAGEQASRDEQENTEAASDARLKLS